jgi:myo-inositol-1(or 4)-monophosphatase
MYRRLFDERCNRGCRGGTFGCGWCSRRCHAHLAGNVGVAGDREPRPGPTRSQPLVIGNGEFRRIAETLAEVVGLEAGDRRQDDFSWSTKSSISDVVTEIDTWAEDEIVRRVCELRPNDGFLGEEGTSTPGTTGVLWVIDPIDGTTNLLYDIPGYSVSIAVQVEGTTVAGAVFDPVRREVFSAAAGGGATRNGDAITASTASELSVSLIGTGFSYRAEQRRDQAKVLATVLPAVRDIRRMGGAALDLCAVACGRLDASYERGLSPWDSAAGALIALEAGAIVDDRELTWTSAPGIADAFRALLTSAGA